MLTRKDRETNKPGISILVQEKKPKNKKRSATSTNRQDKETQDGLILLRLRLKSLQILIFYCVLFGAVAAVLVLLDGPPHFPQRIWSWQEIWDKLSGPAAGVPLDFIKYLVCSLGWFMLAYIGLTFIIEVIVDLLYLFSFRFRGGRPGRVVRSLKSATALLPVSPLRRALDGLMLGAAFFAVVTTVAGGRGVDLHANGNEAGGNGLGTDQDWQSPGPQAAGLVLDTFNFPDNINQSGNVSKVYDDESKLDPAFYKVSFQTSNRELSYHNIPANSNLPVTKNAAASNNLSFSSVQSNVQQQLVDVQHVVKKGDTLWSLAEHYYGDGHLYPKIYQANLNQPVGGGAHFSVAGKIYPGWVLTIPQVDSARLSTGENDSASTSGNNTVQQESYVVQSGDSLRAIAQKLLGDESRWPQIWKLNVGQTMPDGRVAKNPDLIYAGWKLRLPPHETSPSQTQPDHSPQPPVQSNPGGSVQNGNNTGSGNNNAAPVQNDQGSSGSTSPGGNGSGTGQVISSQPTQPPSPAATVQPGSPSADQVQNPVPATPVPTQAPATASNPTPGPATTPAISQTSANTPPVTSKADTTVKIQNPTQAQNQSEDQEWDWPVIIGLGGLAVLAGLGLGLKRVGRALRNRWRNGGLTGLRRGRWQQQQEVKDWEQHNSPQIHAPIEVEINQFGEETGFAYSERPVEFLRLHGEGFDTDKPGLVLRALQHIFADQGLPTLIPVSCIETGEQLTYLFMGSPQSLSAYHKAASESMLYAETSSDSYVKSNVGNEVVNNNVKEEESAEAVSYPPDKAKIIPFLFNRNGRKSSAARQEQKQAEEALQGELVEAIMSRLGGAVWIEKQREGLEITLASVELQHCYRPIAHPDQSNSEQEESEDKKIASSKIQSGEENGAFSPGPPTANHASSNPAHKAVVEEEEENSEVYQAYGALQDNNENDFYQEPMRREGIADNAEVKKDEQESLVNIGISEIEGKLQPRTFRSVRQEFIEISRENLAVPDVSYSKLSGELAVYSDYEPGYLFFGLGATSKTGPGSARLERSAGSRWGNFNLCLETSGNMLLVSSKGDEAAQTVLFGSILQIAVGADPGNLALYPVDRPFTLTADEIEHIPQEFGLSHQAATSLQEELKANHQIFQTITELPLTGLAVSGDTRSELNMPTSTGWAANTTGLLELLLEELVNRRAEAASDKKGSAFESHAEFSHQKLPRLVIIVSDLEAVLAIDKEGLLVQLLSEGPEWGIYTLAAASYDKLVLNNNTNSAQSQTLPVVNHFHSLGLFVAPNEEISQQLWGSSAAFELTGYGDMLFRSSARQVSRLRGFCTTPEQVQKCVSLLKELYNFREHQIENTAVMEEAADQTLDKLKPEEANREVSKPSEIQPAEPSQEPAVANQIPEVEADREVSLQDLQAIWEADFDNIKEEKDTTSSEIEAADAPEPGKSSETNTNKEEPVAISREGQSPEPENNKNQFKQVEAKLQSWRWQMFQEGLIQTALSIYVLHGFSLHFSLLPTYQKSKNGRNGFFPFSPEPLAAYRCLMSQQLSIVDLAGSGYLQSTYQLNLSMKPERVDQIMTALVEFAGPDLNIMPERLPKEFLIEKGFEAGEIRLALKVSQTIFHKLCRIEGANFISQLSPGDLALLAYLALYPGKQSCFSVGQAILFNKEADRLMLKALEGRLSRVKKSLQKYFAVCLQDTFGEQASNIDTIVANLTFIEEHNQRETLKINEKLVYVDAWELDRLLGEYHQPSTVEQSARIHWLEEAYWLVQSTAELHNDGVEESKMKLLGVWGDHNADWTDLSSKRQRVVQRWYDLNMELGNFYQRFWRDTGNSPLTKQEDYLGQALEHYTQSALMLPTYPEPVKALINLYYLKNDLLGLDTVFTDYCGSCEQIDEKPEEDIIALYNRVVRSRSKQLYLPDRSGRKKVI